MTDPLAAAALVSAYPDEASARAALVVQDNMPAEHPYVGVWIPPLDDAPAVHLFTPSSFAEIEARGWVRVDA